MELLRFTVRNQRLSGGRIRLVSDSVDYVEAFFDFRTDDWSGLSKWAHFTKDDVTYDLNLVDDKITADMHLNLEAGTWEIKLHGTDSEGTKRITTDTAYVIVEAFGEGFNPLPEIPLSAAEQIDAKSQLALDVANAASGNASEAILKATEVYEAAQRGDFDGKDGEKGDPGITPEIKPGNVETLEPGADAIVTIGGTIEKPVINFAIPRGEEGVGIADYEVTQSEEEGGFTSVWIYLTDGRGFGFSVMNGPKGETGTAGTPGLVWQGEWNPETTYTALKNGQVSRDVVFYNGSAYVANHPAPITGINPENDERGRWALLARGGDMGSVEDVDERFDAIEEELAVLNPFKVESFTASPAVLEKGDSVSSVVLSWVLNKDPVSVVVNGDEAEAAKSGSVTVNEEITDSRTFGISATDGKGNTVSKSAAVNFYNGIYYGAAPGTIQGVEGLTKVLSGTRKRTFTVTAEDGEYIFYILPASLGSCTFKVGGFEGGFDLYATADFPNEFGYTESYNVYISAQAGLGATTVEVS